VQVFTKLHGRSSCSIQHTSPNLTVKNCTFYPPIVLYFLGFSQSASNIPTSNSRDSILLRYYETSGGGGGALEVYKRCREYPPSCRRRTSNFACLGCISNPDTEAVSSDRWAGLPTLRRNVLLIISEVDVTLKMEGACYFEALHPENEDCTVFPPKCRYLSTIVHGVTSHKQQ
jgi:hypothetical protein